MGNLLTKKDLAEKWQVSEKSIDNWRQDGTVSACKGVPVIRFSPQYIAELEGVKLEKFSPLEGDIGLLINNIETDFYAVDHFIECDSDLQQCYKDNINLGMNMSGNFPILYSGKNVIEFTGNIKQVILTPNWRAL